MTDNDRALKYLDDNYTDEDACEIALNLDGKQLEECGIELKFALQWENDSNIDDQLKNVGRVIYENLKDQLRGR